MSAATPPPGLKDLAIAEIRELEARVEALGEEIEGYLSSEEMIRGYRREPYTVRKAWSRVEALKGRLVLDDRLGIRKHARAPSGLRCLARFAPIVNLLGFGYFLSAVFNVDFSNPARTPIELTITGVFSAA